MEYPLVKKISLFNVGRSVF